MHWITLCETLALDEVASRTLNFPNRWSVQIEGRSEDIRDLAAAVNLPADKDYDPAIILTQYHKFISSKEWDKIETADEIEVLSTSLLKTCVSCLDIIQVSMPMSAGTIYEKMPDNTFVMRRFSKIPVEDKKRELTAEQLSEQFKSLLMLSRGCYESAAMATACFIMRQAKATT